ncbi:MAG TPA: hypothetical protein CFH82_04995 [Sulfurospirillum sp. UBA12182]|nr:MAG TPA: hypothetical protein CFH82_04995 [Sulfurospirillum sp. UBA12182]
MEHYNDIIQTLTLAMGASWASGINLYATLFILGFSALNGAFVLPEGLEILANPLVISAAGLMYCVEFFADKVPGVDTSWDVLHTFIRIPAGALLAAGAVGDMGLAAELAAAIIGGGIASATHVTKAGSRVLINTSPEPFSNWGASVGEDIMVFAGLWTALNHPVYFLILFIVFILIIIWLLPKIWRGIKRVFGFVMRLFGKEEKSLHVKDNFEEK